MLAEQLTKINSFQTQEVKLSAQQTVSIPKNNKDLAEFIKRDLKPSKNTPINMVEIKPDSTFNKVSECHENVLLKVKNDGGKRISGWKLTCVYGLYLEAEFHSVWCDPSGELFDITKPQEGYSHLDRNMFVEVDDPTYEGKLIPRHFYQLSSHPIITLMIKYHLLLDNINNRFYSNGKPDPINSEKTMLFIGTLDAFLEQPLSSHPIQTISKMSRQPVSTESRFNGLRDLSTQKALCSVQNHIVDVVDSYDDYSAWLSKNKQSNQSPIMSKWFDKLELCLPPRCSRVKQNMSDRLDVKLTKLVALLANRP